MTGDVLCQVTLCGVMFCRVTFCGVMFCRGDVLCQVTFCGVTFCRGTSEPSQNQQLPKTITARPCKSFIGPAAQQSEHLYISVQNLFHFTQASLDLFALLISYSTFSNPYMCVLNMSCLGEFSKMDCICVAVSSMNHQQVTF